MKCIHGNEITVMIELYADSYETWTVQRYNAEGKAYNPYVAGHPEITQFQRLRIKGCPECKTIEFEEE